MRLALALLVTATCGHSEPPAPASPTSTAPAQEDCTPDPAMVGKPCAPEGKVCGARQAAGATGFSHVVHCMHGTWEELEVPPPPPPPH